MRPGRHYELGDTELAALPSAVMGILSAVQGRFVEAEGLLTQSLAPLARAGIWEYWILAQVHLATVLASRGPRPAAIAAAETALAQAREFNNLTGITQGECACLIVHAVCREYPLALDDARRGVQAAERSGDRMLAAMAIHFRAWVESKLGRHASAAAGLAAVREMSATFAGTSFPNWFAALDAEIALDAGRVGDALAGAEEAVEESHAHANEFAIGIAQRVWAQALAQSDPPCSEQADFHLAESLRALETCGARVEAARTRVAWGHLCRARDDRDGALRMWQRAAAQLDMAGLDQEAAQVRTLAEDIGLR